MQNYPHVIPHLPCFSSKSAAQTIHLLLNFSLRLLTDYYFSSYMTSILICCSRVPHAKLSSYWTCHPFPINQQNRQSTSFWTFLYGFSLIISSPLKLASNSLSYKFMMGLTAFTSSKLLQLGKSSYSLNSTPVVVSGWKLLQLCKASCSLKWL